MDAEKSVRRARQNYLNALRRLQKERALVITSIEICRSDIVADNQHGVETRLDFIEEKAELQEIYLSKKRDERWDDMELSFNSRAVR